MRYLSQRDPLWSSVKIGKSFLTIARWGCTLTCISMLSDYFGKFMNPAALAEHGEMFTKDGLILWDKIKDVTGNFKWDGQRYRGWFNEQAINNSLKDPNKAVLVEVNYSHWLLPVRKMWLKNDYVVVDPWTGKVGAAIGDYGKITGSAHFERL